MITHELLPIDPSPGEIFVVPEDVQIKMGAFIHVFDAETKEFLGEAHSLTKIPNCAQGWILNRIITLSDCFFETEKRVEIHTSLLTASRLCFNDVLGWVVLEYNDKPIQKTVYTGTLSLGQGRVFGNHKLSVYEDIRFQADKKGETK